MTLKKKYPVKEDGNIIFSIEMTHPAYEEFMRVKKFLNENDFKYQGTSENEALFATGAWRRTEKLLVILADAEPFDDKINGLVHPDPFNAPVRFGADIWVLVYVNPRWEEGDDQDTIPDPGNCDEVLEMIAPTLHQGVALAKSLIGLLNK